jgi:mRNA interferase RelE/StbE
VTIRVTVRWTATAKESLVRLPKPVQRGFIRKIGDLRDSDPRQAGKSLTGPLKGYRSITHGRYRALFSVEEEPIVGGDILLHVLVHVEAVGIRKEHDKRDVYTVAKKLVELGLIPFREIELSESSDDEDE